MTTTPQIAVTNAGDDVSRTTLLSIRNVAKRFGRNLVLRDISLEVKEENFSPSLAKRVGQDNPVANYAGFETASAGEVWMGDARLDRQPPTVVA